MIAFIIQVLFYTCMLLKFFFFSLSLFFYFWQTYSHAVTKYKNHIDSRNCETDAKVFYSQICTPTNQVHLIEVLNSNSTNSSN